MDNWIAIVGTLFGGGGLVAVLTLFIVPASKRHEEIQSRIAALEERVQGLEDANSKLTAAVAVLVQHDEMLRGHIKRLDPNAVVTSAEEVLERVGLSWNLIFNPPKPPKSGAD